MFTFLAGYLNYYSVKSTSYNSNSQFNGCKRTYNKRGTYHIGFYFSLFLYDFKHLQVSTKEEKNLTIHFFHLKNRNRLHISRSHKVPKDLVVSSSQSCCDQAYWSDRRSTIYLSPQSFPSLWACKLHSLICWNKIREILKVDFYMKKKKIKK